MAPATARPASMALPARAIKARLFNAVEPPAWAAYLPDSFAGLPRPKDKGITSHHLGQSAPLAESSVASLASSLPVMGNVWVLACDPDGCREVQKEFEGPGGDAKRVALASELHGHVWEAVRCPHANHVIQKCIVAMKPQASQFIIDELVSGLGTSGGASQAARHRYGCRIVERLVEHCSSSQVSGLIEDLVNDVVVLSKHPYGNYVMQHLLEHGPIDQRRKMVMVLAQNANAVGSDCYARAVVSKALNHAAREEQVSLAQALLREPGLIATMARTRHGHVAAKFVLQHLDGPDRDEARRQLFADLAVLRASRYGRFVAACLDHTMEQDTEETDISPIAGDLTKAYVLGGG